jgi:hypothetical protein
MAMERKKQILGIPYNAWTETFLLLLFLLGLNVLFGTGKRWVDDQLHPFWIVVVLISARYGTLAGVMSAVASTLCLYVGNLPAQTLKETFFDYQFRLAVLPSLWMITAFVLGEMRLRLEERNRHLEQDLTEMRRQADIVVAGYEKLKAAKEYQELSVASQKQSAAALYETCKTLISLNPGRVLRDIDQMIMTALSPKKFSIYAWGPNGFEAASCYGWTPEDHYLRRIPVEHPLSVEIARNRRLVCIVNVRDEPILDGQGLIAAPLIDTESQVLFGLAKIEAVNFMEFTVPTLTVFKILCELIGKAYSHAHQYQAATQSAMAGRHEGVFSKSAYTFQRQFLQKLSEIQPLVVSEIAMTVSELPADPKKIDQQEMELARILVAHSNPPTQIFEAGSMRLCFHLLLPGVSTQQAESLALRLVTAISACPSLANLQCTQKISSVVPISHPQTVQT